MKRSSSFNCRRCDGIDSDDEDALVTMTLSIQSCNQSCLIRWLGEPGQCPIHSSAQDVSPDLYYGEFYQEFITTPGILISFVCTRVSPVHPSQSVVWIFSKKVFEKIVRASFSISGSFSKPTIKFTFLLNSGRNCMNDSVVTFIDFHDVPYNDS